MEYLVLQVNEQVPSQSRNKLGSPIRVIEVETGSAREIELALIKAFGHPSTKKKFLLVELEDSVVYTLRPAVSTEVQLYSSYSEL